MTRRGFAAVASAAAAGAAGTSVSCGSTRPEAVTLPLRQIVDASAKLSPARLRGFEADIWGQAERGFASCGVRFERTAHPGDIWRPPGREPVITGLAHGALNMVVTGKVPIHWDNGRGWSGVSLIYRGYHVTLIALDHAHGHIVPFVSVNTCVHELLHAVMLDIYERRPRGAWGQARETRIDTLATRMWLASGAEAVRESARAYAARLRQDGLDAAATPSG